MASLVAAARSLARTWPFQMGRKSMHLLKPMPAIRIKTGLGLEKQVPYFNVMLCVD